MKKLFWIVGLVLVLAAVSVALLQHFKPETLKKFSLFAGAADAPEVKVENFELLDHKGRWHALHRQSGSKAVVLFSTANGCQAVKEAFPMLKALRAKFEGQGVVFWMIDSSPEDDRASIARETEQLGIDLPVLEDRAQLVANALGIGRTCHVVCIGTTNWMTFYRGAVDRDVASPKSKASGSKNYLENALTEFLAGKTVSPNHTLAKGTPLHLAVVKDATAKTVSYADEVAPLLEKSCVPCHSPGNIGPFAMSSYEKVTVFKTAWCRFRTGKLHRQTQGGI